MSRNVLALDIRHHGVSAVIIKSSLRDKRISGFAYAPRADGAAADGSLATALEAISDSLDFGGCDCVASLPADGFSFRTIQIPFRTRKKIQMVLPFELEPSLPYAVDDIVLDFSPLKHDATGDKTEVLAAVMPKAELEGYLEALSAFDLDPEIITVGGLPLALWHVRRAEVPGDKLILDIDRGAGTLFAAVDGRIQWIRSFPLPADAAAEDVKRQVRLSLAAFEEQYEFDLENSDMVVCGHGLRDALSEDAIDSALGITTSGSDLAADLPLQVNASTPASARWEAHRLDNALALGLAEIEGFQELNVYRSQFPAKKLWGRYKDQLVKTGWLAAAVLVLMFVGQLIESYTLNRRIAQVESQSIALYKATFPEATRIVDPYREMQVQLQQARKTAGYNSENENQVRTIDVLNSISRQIPDSVSVDMSRMVMSPDSIVISGRTDGYDSVDEVKNRLEQISYFKKVSISSSNIDRSGKEVRFQIKAER